MKKENAAFWAMVVTFIFGVSLNWPSWLQLIVVILAGVVLIQAIRKISNNFRR